MNNNLENWQLQLEEVYQKLGSEEKLNKYFLFSETNYDCFPFIIKDKFGEYHIKCYERGQLIRDEVFDNLDDLTYNAMQEITNAMAFEYEFKHRIRYEDNRRVAFKKQVELISRISKEYELRIKEHINKILIGFPYNDIGSYILEIYGKDFLWAILMRKKHII